MLKVLLADDSATARQALKYIIQQADGMDVVGEAVNGRQAVELAETLRPDVILMDIVMPEMDGLEATSEIMQYSPTPIVVVSSTVEGPETETAFQAIRGRGAHCAAETRGDRLGGLRQGVPTSAKHRKGDGRSIRDPSSQISIGKTPGCAPH